VGVASEDLQHDTLVTFEARTLLCRVESGWLNSAPQPIRRQRHQLNTETAVYML